MFTPQDNTGTVIDANAYCTVAFLRQYFTDKNNNLSVYLDVAVEGAIVSATQFIDMMFDFLGYKLSGDIQTTEFPRYLTTLPDPAVAEIPRDVKYATCELALYVLSGKALIVNLSAEETGISEIDKQVDIIKKRIKYAGTNSSSGGVAFIPFAEVLLQKSGWLLQRSSAIGRM